MTAPESDDVRADMIQAQDSAARISELESLLAASQAEAKALVKKVGELAKALVEAEGEDDGSVFGTHAGVDIIAPPGTKRHQLGRVGTRLSGPMRDLNLWGTWTFTFQGRQRRGGKR